MNDWDRGDSFWDIAMNIKEAMEQSTAARIAAYIMTFFTGLACVFIGALGQKGVGWIVFGVICWVVMVIDIVANYLRNSGRL